LGLTIDCCAANMAAEKSMNDRALVKRLLEIGVTAYRRNPKAYATPAEDPNLADVGAATLANLLEELGRHRLIGDVQPHWSPSGAGFRFQVTSDAANLMLTDVDLERWLDRSFPLAPKFDLFISYASGDAAIAAEFREHAEQMGITCFMAERDIVVASEWQDSIRAALLGSKRVLLLITPRSINRPWIWMETGAAWALGKPLIPALSHVEPNDLLDPIRRYQARTIETIAQRRALINELANTPPSGSP
jgi:hypothetical protein